MKKHFIFCVFLLLTVLAFAQGNFKVVQQQAAHYPFGAEAFQEYFNKNLTYSEEAYAARANGEIVLNFDVLTDSTISNVVVLQGKGYGIDEAVVNLLKPLKFAPAVSNNVVIRSNVIMSVYVKAIKQPTLQIEK